MNAPNLIIQSYLINEGFFTSPTDNGSWPLFLSHLRDDPSNAGAIYDNSPKLDGRGMRGTFFQHFALSLTIRALDYETGWLKMYSILNNMALVSQETLTVDGTSYTIGALTNSSGVLSLGIEEGTKRRRLFAMNFLATIKENE